MARTIGAKDKKPRKSPVRKPKSITLTLSQVQAANHLDIPVEAYAKELVKLKRKPRQPRIKKQIDWERLAKNLQKALHDEIKENENIRNVVSSLDFKVRSLEHQVIGYQAVISYLESKNGHDSV